MQDHRPESKAPQQQLLLGLILAIGVGLRLFRLDFQSLWFDEVSSVLFAKQPTVSEVIAYIKGDFHPPFYYLLLHFWIKYVGGSDFSVRLLSSLVSILGLVCFYRTSSLFLRPKLQLIATLFISLALFNVWYAQEVRAYGLVMLLSILSMHYLLRFKSTQTLIPLGLYVLSSTALLYTHYFAIFLIITQNILVIKYVVCRTGNEVAKTLIRWSFAQGLIVLCFLPWLPIFIGQLKIASGSIWIPEPTFAALLALPLKFISYREFYDLVPQALWVSILVFVVLLGLSFSAVARRLPAPYESDRSSSFFQGNFSELILWLLAPTILSFISSYFWVNTFYFRNLIISAPALYILLAAIVSYPRQLTLRLLIFAAIIGCSVSSYLWYYTKHHKEDWRATAQLVDSKRGSSDQLVFESPWVRMAYDHYTTVPLNVIALADQPSAKILWVIKAESNLTEDAIVARFTTQGYRLHRVERFPGISALKFVAVQK